MRYRSCVHHIQVRVFHQTLSSAFPDDFSWSGHVISGITPVGFPVSGHVLTDIIPVTFLQNGQLERQSDRAIISLVNLNATNKWST